MKKTLALCMLAIGSGAIAAPVTPDAALRRALGDAPMRLRGEKSAMRLVETVSHDNVNSVYLFSGDNGFIVTSADDEAPAILGYGTETMSDSQGRIPDNFRYWLDFMAQRVALGIKDKRMMSTGERPQRAPIATLCATRWNQDAPFNNKCPKMGFRETYTGCVATAMAQVMKYHSWPDKGTGSLTYTWERGNQEISTDFSSYTFDWSNMQDTYFYSTANTPANNAVADLMRAAGGAVKMNYGSSASGAFSVNIAPALATYFKYDKTLRFVLRDYFTLMEWEEMIYENLANVGPVVYDGQSTEGGHSFVCDGYDKDGYFHINWGWGGMSDGYFLLDVLDPENQGIGGGTAFDSGQDAVLGIRPDRTGESKPADPVLWAVAGIEAPYTTYQPDSTYKVLGIMRNNGPLEIPATTWLGAVYENMDSGEKTIVKTQIGKAIPVGTGFLEPVLTMPDTLEYGLYKLYFATSANGTDNWNNILIQPKFPQYILLQANEKGMTLNKVKISLPEVTNVSYPATYDVSSNLIEASIDFVNNSDARLKQPVRLDIYKNGILYAYGNPTNVNVFPEETCNLRYTSEGLTLATDDEDAEFQPGTYQIFFTVRNDTGGIYIPLTDPATIEISNPYLGVEGVGTDIDERTEWLDLQGRRVTDGTNLAPGVYIKRTGNTTEKVIVR